MKFGKYLATRQLELPEYSGHFINYKQLKKLINALSNDKTTTLQDKKGSFFFRLERELEKVNEFYLEKESELKFRLDILIQNKTKSIEQDRLTKNSITYISLYDGFKKFSKDLDRLEQFVGLNETGFTKTLKKWDKKSKSNTRELYLTTAVNVQPIFHRNQIVDLSDLVANNLLELEAIGDGDTRYIRYEHSSSKLSTNQDEKKKQKKIEYKATDQLYTDFYEITLQNANLAPEEQAKKLKEWSDQAINMLSPDTKKFTLSKVFLLLIGNSFIPDTSLVQFYESFKDDIDLQFVNDLNKRNCLIEVAACEENRLEILEICLHSNLNPADKDVTGRTCLHYITEHGRVDFLNLLLEYIGKKYVEDKIKIIDQQDYESISPLLLAIINDRVECAEKLLDFGADGFPLQNDSKPQYLPLNVACKIGNQAIVELLLGKIGTPEEASNKKILTRSSQSNAEGLLPLHIVASSGNHHLVDLLLNYGADINQLDKLNKWSSIFYAVFTGDVLMTESLIKHGADFTIKDEDNWDPLYYAIWEGNIGVLNVLMKSNREKSHLISDMNIDNSLVVAADSEPKKNNNILFQPLLDSVSLNSDLLNNIDIIPELSLPPPIIPLRKYGHNFLEERIFLKLSFYTNRNSISLHPNTFLTSIPGRITSTCTNTDLIPRNMVLPVLDFEKSITFQVGSIDENFNIDFELFPTFGTRLIAKSSLTASLLKSRFPGIGSNMCGDLELPLLDVRLKNIGLLKLNYELIYPYSGIPLEISMYDTYWKSSTTANAEEATKSISYVTSSSLVGDYYKVSVYSLNDGMPIISPKGEIEIAPNVHIPISTFDFNQIKSIIYKDEESYLSTLNQLKQKQNGEELLKIINNLFVPLNLFLENLSTDVAVNLQIVYPTVYELENFDLKFFNAGPQTKNRNDESPSTEFKSDNSMNHYIDSILANIFNHVRHLRSVSENQHASISRSLLLSSNNPSICTALNWKQPNFPVFFNLNGIKYDDIEHKFYECTANGLIKHNISNRNRFGSISALEDNQFQNNTAKAKISINNIDSINKDSSEFTNSLEYEDRLTRSIKLALNYAVANNFLGMTVSKKLISVSPEIGKMIRSKGLVLVATIDGEEEHDEQKQYVIANAVRRDNILLFEDSIDV